MSGIGGCWSGCQSGASDALRACVSVMPTVLFGTWRMLPSSFGPGTAGATGYAQPGMPGALVIGAAGGFCARDEIAEATTMSKVAGSRWQVAEKKDRFITAPAPG